MGRAYDFALVEARWRAAWDRARCFTAQVRPGAGKFFNYDSGPFPNGPLHMGHVRTYVLGDTVARYRRLTGKAVLYCTEWDAFGLPNEAAANAAGIHPAQFVKHWMTVMERQLREVGISYDWERVRSTCDPAYVRVTQWLFLELMRAGFVERRETEAAWCSACRTTVGTPEIAAGNCSRCASPVEARRRLQWIVRLGDDAQRLDARLDRLTGWSDRVRRAIRALVLRDTRSGRSHDWIVSRQRAWGTPVPVVLCENCGPVGLAATDLPIGPAGAAGSLRTCPACGAGAKLECDTLDCFFDDIWCFLAGLIDLEAALPEAWGAASTWMPVDHFHSGLDTLSYLPLHRFLGEFLHARSWLAGPEPILRYDGNEMVLKDGRKMSKHTGNAVAPDDVLARSGADALRIGILWAAGPERAIEWTETHVQKAERFLDRVHALYSRAATRIRERHEVEDVQEPSAAARRLQSQTKERIALVLGRIEEYRPHAALNELSRACAGLDDFLTPRLHRNRLSAADFKVVQAALKAFAQALSPLAPHLAEELWRLLGEPPFVFQHRIQVS